MIKFITRGTEDNDDFLNRRHERNSENTEGFMYNCGGFALGTYNWYFPYDEDEREELCVELYDSDDSDREIAETLLRIDLEWMLEEFGGQLRVIKSFDDLKADEVLIAYRVGYDRDLCRNFGSPVDGYDFHYKVYVDGAGWYEKCGLQDQKPCRLWANRPWEYWDFDYNSSIVYLALKEI